MTPEITERLKHRYHYAAWHNQPPTADLRFVWQLYINGNEFPQWQLLRARTLPTATALAAAAAPPESARGGRRARIIHSMWRHDHDPDRLISVNTYECPSQAAADEFLVQLLGEFQSGLIRQHLHHPIGDIFFASAGGYAIVFRRANIVVLLRNANRPPLALVEAAQQYDTFLLAKPTDLPTIALPAPAHELFQRTKGIPLPVADSAAPGPLPMYKFFANAGAVQLVDDLPVYQPDEASDQVVEVHLLTPQRNSRYQLSYVS
ncbi:MAG: hypothetical protein DYG89_40720 [Caldilinea sp. CFX5]|nr:hypothetical protein [Caldilinea sp. CFX5]